MYFDEVRIYHKMHVVVLLRQHVQNGWPSVTSPSVQPNSPNAVANIVNEKVSASCHRRGDVFDGGCKKPSFDALCRRLTLIFLTNTAST